MFEIPFSVYKPLSKNDATLLRRKHYEKWENFFFNSFEFEQQPAETTEVRDVILQSWNRCKEFEDLNPMIQGSVKNISDEELKTRQENEVFQLVHPVLKQAGQDLSHENHVLLFCDQDGTILESSGDSRVARNIGNTVNANNGAQWSERWAGTNAIGTSMILKQPVQIFSSEHFAYNCHEWACSSAPILDPLTKKLLGIINLSTPSDQFHSLTMMKTIGLANQIERVLFHNYYQAREIMQNIYIENISKWKNQTVLLCNSSGEIIRMNDDAHADELTILMKKTVQNNNIPSQKEWEEELILHHSPYQAKYQKIFWYDRFIGFVSILEKKRKSNPSITPHNHVAKYSFHSIIGKSESFKSSIHLARVAASGDSNVLITGDSGTGKELVASAIHKASNRSDHPFIALNCAAIPKDLLPSELFGYVAGAFTGANPKGSIGKFELANKGTLFLDELGDMPLELQVQLLRVIQEQEIVRIGDKTRIPIDVRVIAATNKNLVEEIQTGNFRKDLFYRLNVIQIELPRLRDRSEDIPLLANHFIEKLTLKKYHGPNHITAAAMDLLLNHSWPGNIRELENVMEYAANFSTNGIITPDDLPKHLHTKPALPLDTTKRNPVKQAEVEWIITALKRSQMNVSKTAKELNMSRSTLYRKLKSMGYNIKELK
ncbi:sigma-54-dependent Fis family transcriptional regulator [Mesobacillus maritimus]|uniref:sigma-54-dependent Fis family transcriptional regulator n=1 Tax=Mesobacillus maritimus TaxID=1643336 RepID=UPI0020405DA2|nr:sigma-54-dependent Fis family transcriptional regulator [Mesobacillus maritimus]MCM3588378.1 sigma-54-dependent Fis family transcriptional regulator [Mesobacillus maritimus]